jgi:hypothetical protein
MCEPVQFKPLPHVLGREIVETWLDAHSIAILDRAHCCKQSRIRFDALVDGTCLRNVMPSRCGGRAGKIRNADNLIRWLQKMNMRVESFVVPCSHLSDGELLLNWMQQVGGDVTSVCFEPAWRVGKRRPDGVLSDIMKCFPNVEAIDMANLAFKGVGRRSAINRGLCALVHAWSLREIVAAGTGLTDETVSKIAHHCRNLRHLDVRGCSEVTSATVSTIAQSCPELVCLDVNGTRADNAALASIAEHCPLLQRLEIAYTDTVAGHIGATLVQGCPDLTFLCCETSDDDMRAIGAGYPNLEALVSPHSRAGDEGLIALATGCPDLLVLDLFYCSRIGYLGLHAVSQRCCSLQVLGLASCEGVDDDGIGVILYRCHKLQTLRVGCCRKLTDASAQAIANYGKGLVAVDVEGCLGVSVNGIRFIGERSKSVRIVSCVMVPDHSCTRFQALFLITQLSA